MSPLFIYNTNKSGMYEDEHVYKRKSRATVNGQISVENVACFVQDDFFFLKHEKSVVNPYL